MKSHRFTYLSKDGSLEYKFLFIVKHQLTYTHYGKSYPKHTQCMMFKNGLLQTFSTIVKHANDKDDPVFAHRRVAENCMKTINWKSLRAEIRVELHKFLEALK